MRPSHRKQNLAGLLVDDSNERHWIKHIYAITFQVAYDAGMIAIIEIHLWMARATGRN